jgi:mono/diheme cytochrome c family protein
MKIMLTLAILAVATIGASAALRPQTAESAAVRSVWAGVYSDPQAKRGDAIYARECSTCHGERLKGGEGAPALAGPEFISTWNGQTVGDLFDRITQTMPAPPEQPGKLTPQQTADVVGHILSVNGFPAGATELGVDLQALKRIRIEASKP